jgi:hypothetical protein
MNPFQIPDPHTVHVQVDAKAKQHEVEEAIKKALASKFTDLSPPATNELIIHVKFGP